MKNIIDNYFEFYKTFSDRYTVYLKSINIGILSEFLENKNNIVAFHNRYIQPNSPRIVMCGINPGRRGAGITGIPFIDTLSLSKLVPDVNNPKSEKSAKFFFSIIEEIGISEFYRNVHVTNMSWLGFYKLDSGKNVNYNSLPVEIQNVLIDKFVEEMQLIKPDIIIPMGDIVHWELLNLERKKRINAKIEQRLYHPASLLVNKKSYIDLLKKYI
jgi:hypothetical protein